jgi:hypothetical protein
VVETDIVDRNTVDVPNMKLLVQHATETQKVEGGVPEVFKEESFVVGIPEMSC